MSIHKKVWYRLVILCVVLSWFAIGGYAQITQPQTIGAPHTQITNRGFFDSDSAIHMPSDTIRNGRIGSLAIINKTIYVQAPNNGTDSAWTAVTGALLVTVGPIDSLAPSANGATVINNRIFFQRVTPGNLGMLDAAHFINFQHAWAIVKNSSSTTLFLYPDTATHAAYTATFSLGALPNALQSLVSGLGDIAIGRFSQNSMVSGNGNVSIGDLSLQLALGSNNIAIGPSALRNSGGANSQNQTAVGGGGVLGSCQTCDLNDAYAYLALFSLVSGEGNHASGTQVLQNLVTGSHNSGSAWLALNQLKNGSDNTADGFGSNSGAGQFGATVNFCTTYGSLSADLNSRGMPLDLFGYENLQDDTCGFDVASMGYHDITRALADSNICLFGDNDMGGASPVMVWDRSNKLDIIIGDSDVDNILGTTAASVHHDSLTLIGSYIYDNSDTLRTDVTEIASHVVLTRNHFANFGNNTQVVQLGNMGMSTAALAKITMRNSDIVYNTDSLDYQQYDSAEGYWYKWRKVITGSASQTVGTPTANFVVTLPVTLTSAAYNVQVTPTSALSAALFFVNTKTTSSFTVTYPGTLTGTVTFDWVVTK